MRHPPTHLGPAHLAPCMHEAHEHLLLPGAWEGAEPRHFWLGGLLLLVLRCAARTPPPIDRTHALLAAPLRVCWPARLLTVITNDVAACAAWVASWRWATPSSLRVHWGARRRSEHTCASSSVGVRAGATGADSCGPAGDMMRDTAASKAARGGAQGAQGVEGAQGASTSCSAPPEATSWRERGAALPPRRRMFAHALLALCLSSLALGLFGRGFALSRRELPTRSEGAPAAGLQPARAFDAVLVVLVDALRPDMVFPTRARSADKAQGRHVGAMRFTASLGARRRGAALRFVADAPTATHQRLKALLTGGLPTFVDVGESFGSSALGEDTLVHQLRANGRRVWAFGDDTWDGLLPNAFDRASFYPSFDVKDLDTVDRGAVAGMEEALAAPGQWDVAVAHFLGVDHCGHTYAVDHASMHAKLRWTDEVVEAAAAKLAQGQHGRALLIVMGDHGQTMTGDHGGQTPEETNSVLVAAVFGDEGQEEEEGVVALDGKLLTRAARGDCGARTSGNWTDGCLPIMPQLDFAATLALMMGVPVPFSSLGAVSADLWALAHPADRPGVGAGPQRCGARQSYATALRHASEQVHRFIAAYLRAAGLQALPEAGVAATERLRQGELDQWAVFRAAADGEANFDVCAAADAYAITARNYLLAVASLARAHWTQFDLLWMAAGAALMVAAAAQHTRRAVSLLAAGAQEGACSGALDVPGALLLALTCVAHALCMISNSLIVAEGGALRVLAVAAGLTMWRALARAKPRDEGGASTVPAALTFVAACSAMASVADPDAAKRISPGEMAEAAVDWGSEAARVYGPMLLLVLSAHRRCAGSGRTGAAGAACFALTAAAWAEADASAIGLIPERTHALLCLSLPRAAMFAPLLLLALAAAKAGAPRPNELFALVSAALLPLLGKSAAAPLLCLTTAWWSVMSGLQALARRAEGPRAALAALAVAALLWWRACALFFFATGHACVFTALQYGSAFVGFDTFEYIRCGAALAANTWSHALIGAAALPALTVALEAAPEAPLWAERLAVAALGLTLQPMLNMAVTLCFTLAQRRHLMVWALFAPKLMFDAGQLFVACAATVASCWLSASARAPTDCRKVAKNA